MRAAVVLLAALLAAQPVFADDRDDAIAAYTRKMQEANYPAQFDKAAAEFGVPPDVLKAVSFTETRWTQLQWPEGETVSPENGMPHAYGIMSLWDNDHFGHTLALAAGLIGESPETLKTDVFQNMRGGAALLRHLYETQPKPTDTGGQIEGWRYAIAAYTGIPQPDLAARHVLRVYEMMNAGYHEYGIEWPAHPVNLEPMREDVARLTGAAQLGQTNPAPGATKEAKPVVKAPRVLEQATEVAAPAPKSAQFETFTAVVFLRHGLEVAAAALLLRLYFLIGRRWARQ